MEAGEGDPEVAAEADRGEAEGGEEGFGERPVGGYDKGEREGQGGGGGGGDHGERRGGGVQDDILRREADDVQPADVDDRAAGHASPVAGTGT